MSFSVGCSVVVDVLVLVVVVGFTFFFLIIIILVFPMKTLRLSSKESLLRQQKHTGGQGWSSQALLLGVRSWDEACLCR